MSNSVIGVKRWLNYSAFNLFSPSSQRADRPQNLFSNTYEGNLTLTATDIVLQGRIMPLVSRAYNHLDTTSGLPRPFGEQYSHSLDECLTGTLGGGSGSVTHKDGSGNEWEYTYSSTSGGYDNYTTPRGLKTLLKRNTSSGNFELTSGKVKFTFEVNDGSTMALLTKTEDKYGNALKIVRILSNNKPTVKIDHVDIHYYDPSQSGWFDKQIMLFRYVSGKNLIETIRLDDTLDANSNYVYLHYSYTTISSKDYLEFVYWRKASDNTIQNNPGNGTNLDMTLKYAYDGAALLQYVYDSIACSGTPTADTNDSWKISYSGGKVSEVRYRNSDGGTGGNYTATTTYAYDVTTGLPFTKLNANNKVTKITDGEGRNWWYEHEYDSSNTWKNGRLVRAADPLYDDTNNRNDIQYTWNDDHNLTEVKTWEPNAGTNQITTKYFYNTNKNLEVIQDTLGFLSFYKYDTNKPDNLTETYTQKPNQNVTTTPPSDPDIGDVLSDVDGYYYNDGTTPTAQKIRLVKTTITYTANDDLSTIATPLGSTTTYNYDSTTGDMTWVKDPRQTDDGSLGRTDYAYDKTYGVVTSVTNALSQVTSYDYNPTKTRVTKVALPKGSSYYTEYTYTDTFFLDLVKRPNPSDGTGSNTLTDYDYDKNGNVTDIKIPDVWASGLFSSRQFVYDRLNRVTESKARVDLQDGTGRQWLTTKYGYDRVNNQLWAKDPDNYVTLNDYDAANRLVKVYEPFQNLNPPSGTPPTYTPPQGTPYVQYTLDKLGNTKTLTDMRGNDTDYTYDKLSRITEVSNTVTVSGQQQTITTKTVYDSSGLIYNTENGEGKKTYFIYDDDSRLINTVRLNRTTGDRDKTEYDKNANALKYYDFEGYAASPQYYTEYEYDKLNRRVNVKDNLGNWNVADTDFDANGNLYKTYDRVNSSATYFTKYYYDYWDRLIKVEFPQVKDKDGNDVIHNEEYTYNLLSNRTGVNDRNGNTTNYFYDELGRVIKVELPGSPTYRTRTYYNTRGFVDHIQHTNNSITSYTYDAAGRPTEIDVDHDATTDITYYTYDDNGNITQIDYPDGGKTKYTYDEINRRTKTEVLFTDTPSNVWLTTTFVYNKVNKPTSISHPTGLSTSYTYDDLSLLTDMTAPGNFTTSYDYDKDNRTTQVTNPDNLITVFTYNKNGWTTKVTNKVDAQSANDIVVEYGYDNNGSRTSEKDPLAKEWNREYDAMLRNTKILAPLVTGQQQRKEVNRYFDGNGDLVKVVDFAGITTNYLYNERNQRSSMGWGASSNNVTYSWNCCRVTGYSDATGSASLSYDELSRLTSYTDTQNNQVQYQYDSMNRTTQITDHTNSNTTYAYNKGGAVTRVATPSGNTDYTYDSAGRVSTRSYPNRIKTSYTYDNSSRVTQMKFEDVSGQPVTVEQYDFTYTGMGQAYTRTELSNMKWSYTHDKLRRLTFEKKEDLSQLPARLHYSKEYEYDKAGNRSSYIHTNGQGFNYGLAVNYSYNYDEMGRVTSITDSGRNYSAALTNDWNGNITRAVETWTGVGSATSTFTYDNENRLTAYTIGGAGFGADHYYDGYNRLIKTEATIGVNTQKFQHIYSGTKHIGSKEVTNPLNPVNGKIWRWGSGPGGERDVTQEVIESPQWSSASANIYFPVNDERSMARRTYDANRNVGDTTEQSYYTEWYYVNGGLVPTRSALGQIPSELFSAYNITLDADRSATPYTEQGLNLVQTDLEYEVTRVKSPVLGRDLNPLGRGDGTYYPNGGNRASSASLIVANAKTQYVGIFASGFGNSMNNDGVPPPAPITEAGPPGPCYEECKDSGNCWKLWNSYSWWPDGCNAAVCRCCCCGLRQGPSPSAERTANCARFCDAARKERGGGNGGGGQSVDSRPLIPLRQEGCCGPQRRLFPWQNRTPSVDFVRRPGYDSFSPVQQESQPGAVALGADILLGQMLSMSRFSSLPYEPSEPVSAQQSARERNCWTLYWIHVATCISVNAFCFRACLWCTSLIIPWLVVVCLALCMATCTSILILCMDNAFEKLKDCLRKAREAAVDCSAGSQPA